MRKLFLLLMGVMLFAGHAMAQRTVSGTVTDENGKPLPNVSVVVRGTTTGTITNEDGKYSLALPANAKALVFSSINKSPIERQIGIASLIDASLKDEDKSLQEVVVTGYGTQKKKDLTGNIASVKGAAIANTPIQSFEQALAGRATGVQITVPSGVLNAPPVFRIRGTNSISLSSQPLIIVDGVPVASGDFSATSAAGNALASINPNDIETIDIAKDAAATAIYGSRAANGVVFITTKRGKSGKARVSYNGSVSWTSVYGVPEVLNAQQYTDFKNMAAANNPNVNSTNPAGTGYTKFATATDANGNLIDTRWADIVYRQGLSHDHNLNVSGGNDNTSYYFSVGYSDQEGIQKKNDFTRKNILFNVDSRINKVLTIGGKISYSNELNLQSLGSGSLSGEAFSTNGAGRTVFNTAPNVGPYKNDGTYNVENGTSFNSNTIGRMNNSVTVGFYNPVPQLDLNRSNSESNHIQSFTYLQLKPISWLTLKSLYAIDYLFVDNEVFQTPVHGDGATLNGNASSTLGKNKRWTWANTAQFDYIFNSAHTVSALVGNEQDRRTGLGFGLNRQNLSDPAFNVLQAGFVTPNTAGLGFGENYLLSSFGRINYDFKKKYYFSGNVRNDQYSAFADKASTFWGASAGWEIAKESFWENSGLGNVINQFKLRGSYGKVGNTAGIGDYGIYSTYGSGLYGGLPTLLFNFAGNPNLQWETSSKIDVGVNLGLFEDRLRIEATRYYNDIKDLILNVPQSPSAGVPNNIPSNVGSMYNKGWEFSIAGTPIQSKDFSWNSTLNITTNKNEVTALAPGLTEILTATSLETVSRSAIGFPLGSLFLVRNGGVDPATGRRIVLNKAGQPVLYQFVVPAGQFQWTNPDGTQYKENGVAVGITQAKDGVMFGNTNPKIYGGFDNTFRYKNFDLNVLLTYQFGYFIYYGSNAGLHDMRFWNNHVDVLTAWSKPGDVSTVPRPVYGDNVSNGSGLPMSYNAFKGDFVKLKNVTLSYTFAQSLLNKVKISSARLFVSGQNLAIFTKYPGPDPEVSSNGTSNTAQGVDRNTIANGRTILFGLNIGF